MALVKSYKKHIHAIDKKKKKKGTLRPRRHMGNLGNESGCRAQVTVTSADIFFWLNRKVNTTEMCSVYITNALSYSARSHS